MSLAHIDRSYLHTANTSRILHVFTMYLVSTHMYVGMYVQCFHTRFHTRCRTGFRTHNSSTNICTSTRTMPVTTSLALHRTISWGFYVACSVQKQLT